MVDQPSNDTNAPPDPRSSDPPAPSSPWTWTRRELQWAVETFSKAFLTLVTIRAVSALAQATPFPVRPAWRSEASSPATATPPACTSPPAYADAEDADEPTILFRAGGVILHEHSTRHPGQRWACPLLDRNPCRDCRWLVITHRGQSQCAARAMVALHDHPRFSDLGIEDVRDLVQDDDPAIRMWLD